MEGNFSWILQRNDLALDISAGTSSSRRGYGVRERRIRYHIKNTGVDRTQSLFPHMLVSVVPYYQHFLNNRLFEYSDTIPNHWQQPQVELKRLCADNDTRLSTWDTLETNRADIFLFFDPPAYRSVLEYFKKSFPDAKYILVLYETPLGPHWFNKQNHDLYDAVMTYNDKMVDDIKYFSFKLPIGPFSTQHLFDRPFEERQNAVMVNTNRYKSVLDFSRPWQIPEINIIRGGWRFNLRDFFNMVSGDICWKKRRIARCAEKKFPGLLDIYGANWDGLKSGWFRRFFPDPPYSCARGFTEMPKLELLSRYRFTLCYENYAADDGYISEKIFDALYAGSVPVYLGDNNIARYVWKDCFIDARNFKSDTDLLGFISSVDKTNWATYRSCAQDYLRSAEIKQFQPEGYANSFLKVFRTIKSRT